MTFTLVGHRGSLGTEPENTLRSFRRAAEVGADMVELDLRVTSDGQLVVLHDHDVARTTNGSGDISALTLAEAKQLDAGEGERIPTFAEVLDVVTVPVQAEIKAPAATAGTVELIRERNLLDRVWVISFIPEVLAETQRICPEAHRGLIFGEVPADAIQQARSLGAEVLCVGISSLTPELAEECHSNGLDIYSWTVNSREQLVHALRCGADGVTSDFPERLRGVLTGDDEALELLAKRG
ncbi:glycerophosphodiester phosphodiesterase [Tenggerimyces flavus]|uniref:Glycerophosphodiester phosphodiesterase n=1 Tax=Tenggerimyces flavus TaxID=1708749 RepID=A0ABV7YD57_9ACTN|nr:glycerophosphodiester phosphodiesterase family protein [Tenggerimyces flavus]MBM7791347.1 glycerophosphoryl diester phosphodiesterase [Tenggerimyces flavus]